MEDAFELVQKPEVARHVERIARGEHGGGEFFYYPGDEGFEAASRVVLRAWGEFAFPPIFRTLPMEKRAALVKLHRAVTVEKKLAPEDALDAVEMFGLK